MTKPITGRDLEPLVDMVSTSGQPLLALSDGLFFAAAVQSHKKETGRTVKHIVGHIVDADGTPAPGHTPFVIAEEKARSVAFAGAAQRDDGSIVAAWTVNAKGGGAPVLKARALDLHEIAFSPEITVGRIDVSSHSDMAHLAGSVVPDYLNKNTQVDAFTSAKQDIATFKPFDAAHSFGSVLFAVAPAGIDSDGGMNPQAVVSGFDNGPNFKDGRGLPGGIFLPYTFNAQGGNDTVIGSVFFDRINGEDGNDELTGWRGADTIDGGNNYDTLTYLIEDGGRGIKVNLSASDWTVVTSTGVLTLMPLSGLDTYESVDSFFNIEKFVGTALVDEFYIRGNVGQGYYIDAQDGNDTIQGGDYILGDTLDGGAGADNLDGYGGNDWLFGSRGFDDGALDVLNGGDGDDTLEGGSNDRLIGGRGNDVFRGGNVIYQNDGFSWIVNLRTGTATRSDNGEIDTLDNVRSVTGGSGNDEFIAGDTGSSFIGGGGTDTFRGGAGADRFFGGTGARMYASGGDDLFDTGTVDYTSILNTGIEANLTTGVVKKGQNTDTLANVYALYATGLNDKLIGNSFANTLVGSSGNDTIDGGGGNDWLHGGADNDQLSGGTGDDTLYGSAGNDTLDGGLGIDWMYENIGDDVYWVDDLADRILLDAGVDPNDTGVDTVNTSVSFDLSTTPYIEHAIAAGSASINLTGNASNNQLIGNAGDNILNGGAGADTMQGGDGNDTYYVDERGDVIREAGGAGSGNWDTAYIRVRNYDARNLANVENVIIEGQGSVNYRAAAPALRSGTVAAIQENQTGVAATVFSTDDGNGGPLDYRLVSSFNGTFGIRTIDQGGVKYGEIFVDAGRSLDFEALASSMTDVKIEGGRKYVKLKVYAQETDVANGGLASDVSDIWVEILDVNEAPGIPGITTSAGALQENSPGSAFVSQVQSIDPDAGDVVKYRFANGLATDPSGKFRIDPNTGEIRLTANPNINFEATADEDPWLQPADAAHNGNRYYVLQIEAYDLAGLVAARSLEVQIANVNEAPNAPTWSTGSITLAPVAENTAFSAQIRATDPDAGPTTFTYEFDPSRGAAASANGRFALDPNTGVVSLAPGKVLDFEASANGQYKIYVRVKDGSLYGAVQELTINVLDVNEAPNAPTWSTGSITLAPVAENTAFSAQIRATDPDAGPTTFTYEFDPSRGAAASANGRFALDPNTGVVSLAPGKVLDFEASANGQYKIYVRVKDGSLYGAVQELTINVLDVNEAPSVPLMEPGGSVNENTTGQTVAVFTDSYDPEQYEIEYVFHSSVPDALRQKFTLQTNASDGSGALILTDPNGLDYEGATDDGNGNRYYLIKIVSRDVGGLDSDPVEVRVYVNDVNERPTGATYNVNVMNENAAVGSTVASVTGVLDPDINSVNRNFRFTLVTDATGNTTYTGSAFSVDALTGLIKVGTGGLPDVSAPQAITLFVKITDQGGNGLSVVQPISVTVNPSTVNSPPGTPDIVNNVVAVLVENSDPVATVATIASQDDNVGGSHVEYELVSNPGNLFAIDARSGVISFQGNANYEATNIGLQTELPGTAQERKYFEVVVLAREVGIPNGQVSGQKIVKVYLNDVNEAPDLTTANATVRISENATRNAELATFTLTDQDANEHFVYELSGYPAGMAGAFRVDDSDPQHLRIVVDDPTKLAVASTTTFTLTLKVTDKNGVPGALSDSLTYTVTVDDVPRVNHPPVVEHQEIPNIREDIGANNAIGGALRASDPDSDPITRFDVVGQNMPFEAREIGGQWYLVVTGRLDYETAPGSDGVLGGQRWYDVQVTATAGGQTSDPQTIRVYIADVEPENTAPVITTGGPLNWTVDDDALVDPFQHLAFSDAEDGGNDNDPNTFITVHITYQTGQGAFENLPNLSGPYQGATFTYVDGDIVVTGTAEQVTAIVQGLRFHTRARPGDGDGAMEETSFSVVLSDTSNVSTPCTVTVDSLAGGPHSNATPGNIQLDHATIAESLGVTQVVGTLSATDESPSALTYSFVTGFDGAGHFEIVGHQVKVRTALNYEDPVVTQGEAGLEEDNLGRFYRLKVTASDGTNVSAPQEIKVYVTDVNEAPTAVTVGALATVRVGAHAGDVVSTIGAVDPDTNPAYRDNVFKFLWDNTLHDTSQDGFFTLDATGHVTLAADVTAAQLGGTHSFTVVTYMAGDPTHYVSSQEQTVQVVPSSTNDAPTAPTLSRASVFEFDVAGTLIGSLASTDANGDPLEYWIMNSQNQLVKDDGRFKIVGSDLQVSNPVMLDSEANPIVQVKLVAMDNHNAVSAVADQRISVLDWIGETFRGDGGDNLILGFVGGDNLSGQGGNDTLSGGIGRDVLAGGSGSDVFVFDTNAAANNTDTIVDFKVAEGDKIHLKWDIFRLGSGNVGHALSDAQFHLGSPTTGLTGATRIIYEKTGSVARLWYDGDGSGTRFTPKLIATFTTEKPDLSITDFLII